MTCVGLAAAAGAHLLQRHNPPSNERLHAVTKLLDPEGSHLLPITGLLLSDNMLLPQDPHHLHPRPPLVLLVVLPLILLLVPLPFLLLLLLLLLTREFWKSPCCSNCLPSCCGSLLGHLDDEAEHCLLLKTGKQRLQEASCQVDLLHVTTGGLRNRPASTRILLTWKLDSSRLRNAPICYIHMILAVMPPCFANHEARRALRTGKTVGI